jgi:hypothetical protein
LIATYLPVLNLHVSGLESLLELSDLIVFAFRGLLLRLGFRLGFRLGLFGRLGLRLLGIAVPSRHDGLGGSESESRRSLELRLDKGPGDGDLGSSSQSAGRGGNGLAEHCEIYEEIN